jgi:hypothetical protein
MLRAEWFRPLPKHGDSEYIAGLRAIGADLQCRGTCGAKQRKRKHKGGKEQGQAIHENLERRLKQL